VRLLSSSATVLAFGVLTLAAATRPAAQTGAPAWQFRAEQIASDFGVGYAVAIGDVNGDKKDDVVAISGTDLVWFEAPTFQKKVMLSGQTPKDNVCLALQDIDRDGKLDVALGATWQPTNTTGGGTLHWVRQGATPDAPWELYSIGEEPTLHRMRWADVDGDNRAELIVVPLHGRGTKAPDWEGQGTRVMIFRPPSDPRKEPWPMEVADDSLHIAHNLLPVNFDKDKGNEIIIASKEGLSLLNRTGKDKWTKTLIGDGAPGEVKMGRIGGKRVIATVEPWHGKSVVVYTEAAGKWPRTVIESEITGGHALGWADFDGDGNDELAVGWRDGKPGVAIYTVKPDGSLGAKSMIDEGGMATEDLAIADLNGDKKPDIVASGRATRNVKIYWNEMKK
jgi:hypothetical protein